MNKKGVKKFALLNVSVSLNELKYTLEKKNTNDMLGIKIKNL